MGNTTSRNGTTKLSPTKSRVENGQFRTCATPISTLSLLAMDTANGHSFRVPRTVCWNTKEQKPIPIGGDLKDKTLLTVDSTRCLLRYKQTTEAVLLHNCEAGAIHICSFTPPGIHRGGVPLFEWGRIERKRRWYSIAGARRFTWYKLITPHDGSYSVRVADRKSNRTHRRTMLVSSPNRGDNACAVFEETETSWECKTMPGIDPAMMLCVLVGIEKLRTTNQHHRGPCIVDREPHRRSRKRIGNDRDGKRRRLFPSKCSETSFGFTGTSSTGRLRNSSSSSSSSSSQNNLPSITSFINTRVA